MEEAVVAGAEITTTEDMTGETIDTKTMSTNTGGDHLPPTTVATDPGLGPVHTVQGVTD